MPKLFLIGSAITLGGMFWCHKNRCFSSELSRQPPATSKLDGSYREYLRTTYRRRRWYGFCIAAAGVLLITIALVFSP